MSDMNEYIRIEEFAEGCKINTSRMTVKCLLRHRQERPDYLSQFGEVDFVLSHVLTKSQ
uniref:Uncharacterized protein n=1 Tax=Felis catus TaxID=9685 RepID=A0ABI7WGU0_FELCA